jgi:hypothetical protein
MKLTEEKLTGLLAELNGARSTVFLAATVLDTGDERTDLELHSAAVLKEAFKAMDGVSDDLFALLNDLRAGEPS